MTYFLQDVARYLFDRSAGDLRETIIVFPNRRARLFFNHFLSQLTDKPLWAPQYYTISDFIQNLSGLQLADPLTLLFRLFKVFQDVTHSNESFDSFYYYCEMILADFDDIDKYQIPADQLYTNLSNLKALEDYNEYLDEYQIKTLKEFWEIFSEAKDSDEKQQFISIWDALNTIYTNFNSVLDSENIAYEGKAYREAIENLDSGIKSWDQEKQIAFVGFNALNYSEELLFDHFKKQGNALFFWDYGKQYIEKEYHEAGYFLRKYLKRFPKPNDFSLSIDSVPSSQNTTTVAVPSTISQAKVINFCMELVDSKEVTSPLQTALILADEGLLIPVVNSLPAGIEKINISMGYPVTDTPAFSLITLLADLQKNKRINSTGVTSFYSKDLFSVYHHELLRDIAESEEFQRFEKECTKGNLVYIQQDEITLKDPVSELLTESIDDPKKFAKYLRQIIEAIANRMHTTENISKQVLWQMEVLQSIHKVLMRFEALTAESGIELALTTTLNLILKIMGGISTPFSGEPLNGLQVMGILETRTLDFKNIIILSMNEGKFPKSGHAPSFIPFTLREGFGLPTVKHQDAIFSYYFYRLLHRAENVVLVYNTKTEGLQKGEPSRYIQQLRFESENPPGHIDLGYRINPFPRKKILAGKTGEALKKLDRYIDPESNSYLSPSAINTYLTCKLKFYFRYIENIQEPDAITESVESNVFGSILHEAMTVLYNDFRKKLVNKEAIQKIRKDKDLISSVIDEAFNKEYFKLKDNRAVEYKGRNIIIRQVIETYINGVLEYDENNTPFTIEALEEKYIVSVPIQNNNRSIRLGGRIDRIDRKDNTIRVVDYKTGRKELTFKSLEELFSIDADHTRDPILQSFLYSWILQKSKEYKIIQPALFFVREILNDGFDPRIILKSGNKTPIENFTIFSTEFEHELITVLEELYNRDIGFHQTDKEDNCKFCPYKNICWR